MFALAWLALRFVWQWFRVSLGISSDDITSHKLEWVSKYYLSSLALRWNFDDVYETGNAALTLSVNTDT